MKVMRVLTFVACATFCAGSSIPIEPTQCGGIEVSSEKTKMSTAPPRRNIALQGSRFCSQYSYGGWGDTMQLHLGEGAVEYRDMVDSAVALWNAALMGFNRKPILEVIDHVAPGNFSLSDGFWSDREAEARDNGEDGQNVIYFKSAAQESNTGGFAWVRTRAGRMVEADVYLNTRQHTQYPSGLALTMPLLHTEQGWIHALVDPLVWYVVHEIGHALGLKHVPVSGNIMSYEYMPAMLNKWQAPAEFLEFVLLVLGKEDEMQYLSYGEVLPPVIQLTNEWELYLRAVFTRSVGLGEQDRMALMCIYDFEDWNH